MKLISYSLEGETFVGATDGRGIANLTERLSAHPGTMIDLIENWDALKDEAAAISDFALPLANVTLLSPIPRPGKIYALGMNYAEHLAEAGRDLPEAQTWFTKPGTAVNAPYGDIYRPSASIKLDYEVELVFVIGKRCKHVPVDEALGAIFGYCVGNDVSVRDWQLRTSQYVIGKSFDTHAPFGPWITLADGIDPQKLDLKLSVNGETRQSSNTRYMIFDCAAQIADLSQAMTLEPGDVIFTGTPSGVGGAMKPQRWLEPGDIVRAEIDGLGAIENRVVDEPR